MSSYLAIAVVCLLIVRLETFQLTRGLKDKFANPECVNGDSCSASQCAQYFARCATESCTVCVCDEVMPTYVASQKRCVKDDDIFPQTVPEYSSFVISSPNGEPYMAASKTSHKLDYEIKYTGNSNQLWLYTPSKKLLNLKTLKCLDFKDTVELRHCNSLVDRNTTQTWFCNYSSSHQLLGRYKGNTLNLHFSGREFYLGGGVGQWVANKGHGTPIRSICDIPHTYKGCYRYTDGSSVKRFIHETQLIDCTEPNDGICYDKFRISAPIFKEDGYNASCFIAWHKSMFSVNDQPWSKINMHESSFHYVGKETAAGEIEFRFLESTKKTWAGALLKLEVECKNQHLSKTKIGTEQHCMLLKFDGVFESSKQTNHRTKNQPESSNLESRYKSITIALSVVLVVIVLLTIVVAVAIYRRRSLRAWVTTKRDDDITLKPLCDSDKPLQVVSRNSDEHL